MTLKEKILSGKRVHGAMLRVSRNPGVCMLAKNAGLDFVMFDCEQAAYSFETLHDMFVMCNALGLAGWIRVPANGREHVSRSLDCGAKGVMVPMLEDAESARELARCAKFAPLGERGYGAGGANTGYVQGGKHAEVMARANAEVLAIAQIETRTGVDNAASIAAVPGIDSLLVGPNDLSVSLGVPGDLMNPVMLEAIGHVAEACRKEGKVFGLTGGVKLLAHFKDRTGIILGRSDTDMLAESFARMLAEYESM